MISEIDPDHGRGRIVSFCHPAGQLIDAGRLKASISVAAVISETLRLRRDGREHVALCPFHGEKTPSFRVYDDGYHCFGCGAHGDVFDWLMATRRITFANAVRYLAGDA